MSIEKFVESLDDEQKEALKKMLAQPLDSEEPDKTSVNKEFKVENREPPKPTRRSKVKAKKNQWVDTGEFRDITTPEVERTPRRRSAPKKESVECHVCGKTFKADPKFMYGEYPRCNKCTGR